MASNQNNSKKYASLSTLQAFLNSLKSLFATKTEVDEKSKVQIVTTGDSGVSTVDVSTLQIHKMTNERYREVLENGNIDEMALYLTPDEDSYTKVEVDTKLASKSDKTHNHDAAYDTKGSAADSLASAKSYTDTKTANLTSTTVVNNKISSHNTSTSAHNDIRDLISGLTTRLNTLANSDDTTLDQMSEIVAYIKNNKSLIDGITTSKVNVADIVNNLTTNVTNKPLSAAQGVAIKSLIDTLQEELDAHTHEIADIDGLTTTLANKADKNHGTHVVYLVENPLMDGTASAGSKNEVARADHRHPTDTSRAAKTDLDSHTSNTTVHITSAERTNWSTAKAHADSAHAPSNAEKNQNAFSNIKVGSTTVAADTATDTLELVGSNVTITPDATNDKITIAVANGSASAKGVVQLTNSTSSTSTTTAATPNSVKSAYDLANTAKTKADSAYTLAESKVDSLSDLGINASATELNYLKGAIDNIQKQLDERRTHWVKLEGFEIVAKVAVSDNDTLNCAWNAAPEDYIAVKFDNVEYRCRMWTNSLGEKCYGDSRITTKYDWNTGTEVMDITNPEHTPFYINVCADDSGSGDLVWTWSIMFNSSIASTSHTVEIWQAGYSRLSENFIPDTIARKAAGIVHQYAGRYAPNGYLKCDGSFYRTDEYPELFDAIGFTYGESGSGVNMMFAVPNLSGRVPVGVGASYALGSTGGEEKHTLTVGEIPSHNHNNPVALETTGGTTLQNSAIMYRNQKQTTSFLGNLATDATGSGAAHNNMQPYIVLNYIISTGK